MHAEPKPIQVGHNPQLFIDDYLVDDIWMIRRVPEMPLKVGDAPLFTALPPFEGNRHLPTTVTYDEDEKVFKMWYVIVDKDAPPPGRERFYRTAYAVSTDGISWEAPELGLIEHQGSKRNSLVLADGVGFVLKDPQEDDPGKRYKMLNKQAEYQGGRVFPFYSPDGIHWTPCPVEQSVIPGAHDGGNPVVYDPRIGKYVLLRRATVLAAPRDLVPAEVGFAEADLRRDETSDEADIVPHVEAEEFIHTYMKPLLYMHTQARRLPPTGQNTLVGKNQRIARSESEDFVHWSMPEVVIRPDELDPPRLYNMGFTLYRGLYIGLLEVYHSWSALLPLGRARMQETADVQLVFSRDGKQWERLANRPLFIPPGRIGEFDGGRVKSVQPGFVEHEDELRIYYTGDPVSHNLARDALGEGGVGLAILPKERLVARAAGSELGLLLTKPFALEGSRLAINANAVRGKIKVEVTDAAGNAIAGFAVEDAVEINRDGLRLPVEWQAGRSLGQLSGQPVRLRFYLWQARLYGFEVAS